MLVEAGKKAKPVLTGQLVLDRRHAGIGALVAARASTVVGHRNAACFAAGELAALKNHYLKAALDELMRGTHAGHAAAQNDHLARHAAPSQGRFAAVCSLASNPAASPTRSAVTALSLLSFWHDELRNRFLPFDAQREFLVDTKEVVRPFGHLQKLKRHICCDD